MKILKILFLLPLSILSLKMAAQVDDLLKNKDITWVAEVYNDFQTSESHTEIIGKSLSRVTLLKFLNNEKKTINERFSFQTMLLHALSEKKITTYKDEDCKIKNPDWASGYDSLVVIDPTTYKEDLKLVTRCIWVGDFLVFRARQIVFYNAKNAQFGLKTLAIAPMDKKQREGKIVDVPYFWMKATDLAAKRQLMDDNITWAAQMNLFQGFDVKKARVLKSTDTSMPMEHFIKVFELDEQKKFFKANSDMVPDMYKNWSAFYQENDLVTPNPESIPYLLNISTRDGLVNGRDTVNVMEGNLSKIKVITTRINLANINRLRLIQEWYWDDQKQELNIRLAAVAPLHEIRNAIGEYFFSVPMFYRRTDID
jgi:hypothetical protein